MEYSKSEIFRCRWAQRDDGIVILAGTSLIKVSILEKDGGVQLPVANVGMEITIVKTSTNASGLDNFRIYPDNMASINGQAIGVHLDVSSTTKVVTCIAFDMFSWICTKQHANGGGSEGGKLESTTIGIESPASSRFSTATVEGELLVRKKQASYSTGTKEMPYMTF